MLDRLREIIAQRWENWGGEIIEFKGEPDHVHILVELPSNLELSRFVNNVKTTSSQLVRRDFGRDCLVCTASRSSVPRVLNHNMRRRPMDGAQAIRGAASDAGITRAFAGGLHPQPSDSRSGWSIGRKRGRARNKWPARHRSTLPPS